VGIFVFSHRALQSLVWSGPGRRCIATSVRPFAPSRFAVCSQLARAA
jgi:hypothetical protein